jgi:UDPglucose 6-dehydrogenase
MHIAVIGTGYVGLVTGVCFAETGNHVICVDVDQEKLAQLNQGKIPIYEPGLEVLFHRNREENRLHFTNDLAKAVKESEIIFFALPTPPMEDGSADLQYVLSAAREVAHLMDSYKILVNKSTVPVGTARLVKKIVSEITSHPFDVVSNPEFLREGSAVNDFMKPDRVIVGVESDRARTLMEKLYKPFVRSGNPIVFMDLESAELTKYAANAFLATKISFMNEIANLAQRVGANVDNVRIGIGLDPRIGKSFLFAGVGYGGSCFPKDVSALYRTAKSFHYEFRILKTVMEVNERQKHLIPEMVYDYFNQNLRGKTIGIWGLAFKPNTDDIREAPSLTIIQDLLQYGASIKAFDPVAMANVRKFYPHLPIHYCKHMYEAAEDVDALVIVTEWSEFRTPDMERLFNLMKGKAIFDGRNVFYLEDMKNFEGDYFSIGRPPLLQKVKTA